MHVVCEICALRLLSKPHVYFLKMSFGCHVLNIGSVVTYCSLVERGGVKMGTICTEKDNRLVNALRT